MTVLYEDNHLIAVAKKAGDIVQGDKTGDVPLSDLVKAYLKDKYQKPGNVYLGVVHRLDRPVSGVVLFAKTSKALPRLNKMFAEHQAVKKTYLAIVANRPPQQEGTLTHWLTRNEQQNTEGCPRLSYCGTKRTLLPPRNRTEDWPPSSDTLPTRQDGLPHQGRPEVWCASQ